MNRLRILFLHGSRGSPHDATATFLSEHFITVTPAMPTGDYSASVAMALAALQNEKPSVLVGESFGAAVAFDLIEHGHWTGPTVLLCPAIQRIRDRLNMSGSLSWPKDMTLSVVHGKRDTIIPWNDTLAVVQSAEPFHTRLYIVDDDHSMRMVVDGHTSPQLNEIIHDTLESS